MKNKYCYVVLFRGHSYRVVVGHLDEFVALMQPIEHDEVLVNGFTWHKMHNLEWYKRI